MDDEIRALAERQKLEKLLHRPYKPPVLYIFEEVELGGGYHTLSVTQFGPERDWSEPYKKSSQVQYRSRTVKVEYPPPLPAAPMG